MRLIDATEVVKAILEERDKIPRTIATAPYEPWAEKPYHAGDQMRGGIRKALRCIEQSPTVDAVPVVRCRECTEFDETEHECSHWYGFRENDFCSYGEKRRDKDGTT